MAWIGRFFLGALLAGVVLGLVYLLPPVRERLEWRIDAAAGVVRGWLHPEEMLPLPGGASGVIATPTRLAAPTSSPAPTQELIAAPLPATLPIPPSVRLASPDWEKQDWNNCGPATLALALRYYGWQGDQFEISELLKPDRGDKNVNVEELVYFVRTRAGWLGAEYRVGGTLDLLKALLAAGYPVIIEESFILSGEEPGTGWAAHYLLLTGYDDGQNAFMVQDTFRGPDRLAPYEELDANWEAFNRVYLLVYVPEQWATIEGLLGTNSDVDANRQQALSMAQEEIEADPQDGYAWSNLGTNLLYFERYAEAALAYDSAFSAGLHWRFTRYQFGPYIAYFNVGRFQDIIELAEATLERTPKAEESYLWRGWAYYRLGHLSAAIDDFRSALQVNPNYLDAQYALSYVQGN